MSEDGQLIAGRYRLSTQVGSGAMGVVWRAEDETLRRTVALKQVRLPSGVDDQAREQAYRRVMREGRLFARIHHPHAIAVFDVVDHDAQPWLVMEYLPSRSLSEVVAADGVLAPRGRGGRGPPGRRRADRRPRGRDRAPRRQARQRPARRRRHGEGDRLRHLPRDRRGHHHLHRDDGRDARLPGPRGRPRRGGRLPLRRLLARVHALRRGGGRAAVRPGRERARPAAPGRLGRVPAAAAAPGTWRRCWTGSWPPTRCTGPRCTRCPPSSSASPPSRSRPRSGAASAPRRARRVPVTPVTPPRPGRRPWAPRVPPPGRVAVAAVSTPTLSQVTAPSDPPAAPADPPTAGRTTPGVVGPCGGGPRGAAGGGRRRRGPGAGVRAGAGSPTATVAGPTPSAAQDAGDAELRRPRSAPAQGTSDQVAQQQAVIDYYGYIPTNLPEGWGRLTSSYQRTTAGGFAGYSRFWDAMSRVTVRGVSPGRGRLRRRHRHLRLPGRTDERGADAVPDGAGGRRLEDRREPNPLEPLRRRRAVVRNPGSARRSGPPPRRPSPACARRAPRPPCPRGSRP